MYHAFSSHAVYGRWTSVRLGRLGVDAFFVLSGFLITLRLLSARTRADLSRGGQWRLFLRRRVARIFPLYYATLAFVATAGPYLGFPVQPAAWPWFVTYTVNVFIWLRGAWVGAGGHLWSLCVEEQFYLLFPLLVLTRAWARAPAIVAVLVAAAIALRLTVGVGPAGERALLLLPLHLDAFGAGILAAACAVREDARRSARAFYAAGLAAASGFFGLAAFAGDRVPDAAMAPLLSVGTAALVLALWNGDLRVAAAVLGSRPFVGLGRISYGFYVVHLFVIVWLWRFRAPWLPPVALLRGAIAFVASTLLAAASWRWFEQPILRYARRRERDAGLAPVRAGTSGASGANPA